MIIAQTLGASAKSGVNAPADFEGITIDQMYREHILDHYKNPRNRGKIEGLHIHDSNPLCGDEIDVYAAVKDKVIKSVSFEGSGCAISQASASMLTEYVIGKNSDVVKIMGKQQMEQLIGISVSAARVKCMMLALIALKKMLWRHS